MKPNVNKPMTTKEVHEWMDEILVNNTRAALSIIRGKNSQAGYIMWKEGKYDPTSPMLPALIADTMMSRPKLKDVILKAIAI